MRIIGRRAIAVVGAVIAGFTAFAPAAGAETIGSARDKPAWSGPLAILADQRTASAAEEFITWARDNGRAVLGGIRTAGAG